MKNLKISVDENNILHIEVDLKVTLGPSVTGKSDIVASSQGNKHVVDSQGNYLPEIINLNITRRRDPLIARYRH